MIMVFAMTVRWGKQAGRYSNIYVSGTKELVEAQAMDDICTVAANYKLPSPVFRNAPHPSDSAGVTQWLEAIRTSTTDPYISRPGSTKFIEELPPAYPAP